MSQTDLFEIGEKVKVARRARRISQARMSAMTGVSRSRIEMFENGRAPEISLSAVLRLMNAVGLDLRPTTYDGGNATFEDIIADNEDEHAPRMGR